MPKKQMRKIIPDPSALRDSWVGDLLGDILKDPYLFHLNRRSVSLGVMVGLFWAFTPIPFQMLPAAITAWIIRANLPLSVALVWISNPVTVPPLLLIAYGIGSWILDTPVLPPETGITMDWVKSQLIDVWEAIAWVPVDECGFGGSRLSDHALLVDCTGAPELERPIA